MTLESEVLIDCNKAFGCKLLACYASFCVIYSEFSGYVGKGN